MSSPIEDYALIGDGQTAALVNRNGSIDWLCWPQFDSDACFCALLGTAENGRWLIAPKEPVTALTRRYEPDTLVLETDMVTATGAVRITDFMPIRDGHASAIVRIVSGGSGRVPMQLDLRPRFDYGTLPPWFEPTDDGVMATCGSHRLIIISPLPLQVADDAAFATFSIAEGEVLVFVLQYAVAEKPRPAQFDAYQALDETRFYWLDWISRFDAGSSKWPEIVKRSLITLRAMVHFETGGLIAAPTTSLPELAGGDMNWDYRYCWLRDSTFTLWAFLNAGFTEEAEKWRDWLLRALAGSPDNIRIMYRLNGSRHLDEWVADSLPGYRFARPVRIGNAAATQRQIDVYGEVIDCLSLARRVGIEVTEQQVVVEARLVDQITQVWRNRDSGVWESRGEPRHFTYSKVMAWAGIDRFLRDGEAAGTLTDERRQELAELRQTMHDDICREAWNEGLGTFTQAYGNEAVDGSLLLLPIVGFLPATDPRMVKTIDRIAVELSDGGLIRRTKALADGPNEGVFLACSFWMVDCLALQGRYDEAEAQFERIIAYANDVGLLSEEYNVPASCLAGNFPQALTHLALVNSALRLSRAVVERHHGPGEPQ
jgi:GH15 family glucan-1,4-alpha-glucosidase